MTRRLLLLAPALALAPWGAQAACSGSGVLWSCTAGSTVAQVQSAINSASDGAVISFAAESYSWSSPIYFANRKSVTLRATPGTATVTVPGSAGFRAEGLTVSKPYRISEFTFTGPISGNFIQRYPVSGVVLRDVQIDNNLFNHTVSGGGYMVIRFGEHSPDQGDVTGVIWKHTFTAPGPRISMYQLGPDASLPWGASKQGTADNIFVEDNLFAFATKDDVGVGCIDGWQKAAMVFRFNQVTNCQLAMHEQGHEGGFTNLEMYSNTLSVTSGIWTDGTLANLIVTNPWGCAGPPTPFTHVQANRDYYLAVSASTQISPISPVDGTTGMGYGTLANRPSTCTPNPSESGAGVGYWATDAGGNWNRTNGTANDGALYRCSATNTWTLHYVPYPYPHPLRDDETPPPSPPTNLRRVN